MENATIRLAVDDLLKRIPEVKRAKGLNRLNHFVVSPRRDGIELAVAAQAAFADALEA